MRVSQYPNPETSNEQQAADGLPGKPTKPLVPCWRSLMSHRYYVYSIEGGYSPHNPLHESDDRSECISVCSCFSVRYDVNCYVVDRNPLTMYEEIYVRTATSFSKTYSETREQIRRLKE